MRLRIISLFARVEAELAQQLNSFDESPEGALMRRYEDACNRELHKNLAELRTQQRERREMFGYGRYIAPPSRSWLPGMESLWEFEDQDELNEDADCYGDDDADETAELEKVDSFSGSSGVVRNEPGRADFEGEAPESWAADPLRNEPGAELDGCEAESGQEHRLRNEPSSGFEGQRADYGQVSELRTERSLSGVEEVVASGAAGSVSRGESRSADQGNSQNEFGERGAVKEASFTAVDTPEVAESHREADFTAIRRDRPHENLIEASRRERRRRKREERRARSRSR